jgi:hypothetical protein
MIYDHVQFESETMFEIGKPQGNNRSINIRVTPSSYLKYFAVCLNRTSGHNITAENLGENIFDNLIKHSIISHFIPSLTLISGKTHGDVENKFVREWIRLCFFANDGQTITQFLKPNVCDTSDFVIDFESFYDGTIIQHCLDICDSLGIRATISQRIYQHIEKFTQGNLYFDIDRCMPSIIDAIDKKQLVDLSQTNIIQQAWIDNHLVEKYNIDPLLRNEYFANTLELINQYNLNEGKL